MTTSRPRDITTYTKNTTGIVDDQVIEPAHQINNYTSIESSLQSSEPVIEDHDLSFKGLERQSHIRFFDDSKVTTGTNSITIDTGATTLREISFNGGFDDRTGWANSGSINVTGIVNGVIWAIYPALTYQATNNLPASKPANAYRVGTFSNNAGVVTWNNKTWQSPIESDTLTLENALTVKGALTAQGAIYALPTNYHDVRVEWVSASQVKILARSRCRSSDDTIDIIASSDITVDITVSGKNGLDTGAEANSTQYSLYLILNPTTREVGAVLSVTNESVSGSITFPSGFTKKRQVLVNGIADEQLVVFNNSAGNIDYIGGSVIWLTGGNGNGSINTAIRRLLTIVRIIGTSATLTQSATNGDSITINKNGVYYISYTDGNTTSVERIGISLNSTQLTTAIQSITNENRLVQERTTAAADFKNCCTEHFLKKSDIIRPHGTGTNNLTANDQVLFKILRKG